MNKKLGITIRGIGIILMIFFSCFGGYSILTGKYWDNIPIIVSFIGVSISLVSVGISIIALSLSNESEQRMKALTKLNYYEKMAMLEYYKEVFADDQLSGERFNRRLRKCCYDIQAISALDQWMMADINKEDRKTSINAVLKFIDKDIKCVQDKDDRIELEKIRDKISKIASDLASENEYVEKTKSAMPQLTKKELLLGIVFVILGLIGALAGNYMWYCVEKGNYCYIHPVGLFACFVFIVLIVWIFRQAEKVE
ncbi:hypothetical protein C5S30_07005 [ANME-1 cluster archaeon GoMg4]|nr:hypothetical protein [ANME-1 cluster archaeon GoMg4]